MSRKRKPASGRLPMAGYQVSSVLECKALTAAADLLLRLRNQDAVGCLHILLFPFHDKCSLLVINREEPHIAGFVTKDNHGLLVRENVDIFRITAADGQDQNLREDSGLLVDAEDAD